jgi:membrane protein
MERRMGLGGAWRLVRDSWRDLVTARKGLKMAAALSYYAALSLAPFVVVVLAVAGLVVDRGTAAEGIAHEMEVVLGRGGAEILRGIVDSPDFRRDSVLATIFGGVMLVIGATGLFVELQGDLNILWQAPPRSQRRLLGFLRHRLISIAMVASVGFLLLVSFLVNGLLALLARPIEELIGAHVAVALVVQTLVSLIVDSLFFALIFAILPDVRVGWRSAALGGALTSVCFLVGQVGISAYLGQAAVGSAYGAAGSFVLLLVWMYYSSLIVLFGAAITWRLSPSGRRAVAQKDDGARRPTKLLQGGEEVPLRGA